jgi:hypothetical protein
MVKLQNIVDQAKALIDNKRKNHFYGIGARKRKNQVTINNDGVLGVKLVD